MKAVFRGTFIALNSCIISSLSSTLGNKNEDQWKPKASRKKSLKLVVEINEIENRKTKEKIGETIGWFFEKIDKMGKYLDLLAKRKREETQITISEFKKRPSLLL